MDIPSLQRAIQHYYSQGLALSTHKSYQAGQLRYLSFCNQFNRIPTPTTETTLLLFIAYLAKDGLAYTSIKVYLSAIRNMHITSGHHHIYSQQLTPYLEQVLQGIKKDQLKSSPQHQRLPITAEIMLRIHSVLAQNKQDYNSIMMWAVCCTAFFGLLRCSEFTVPSINDYDPTVHLLFQDVAIDSSTAPTVIRISIKQSKTDPFRKGIQLFLGTTDHIICPIKAILPYLTQRGSKPGPLFVTNNNTPLTRQFFSASLSAILTATGLDQHRYTTHSFRIGAATSAK